MKFRDITNGEVTLSSPDGLYLFENNPIEGLNKKCIISVGPMDKTPGEIVGAFTGYEIESVSTICGGYRETQSERKIRLSRNFVKIVIKLKS